MRDERIIWPLTKREEEYEMRDMRLRDDSGPDFYRIQADLRAAGQVGVLYRKFYVSHWSWPECADYDVCTPANEYQLFISDAEAEAESAGKTYKWVRRCAAVSQWISFVRFWKLRTERGLSFDEALDKTITEFDKRKWPRPRFSKSREDRHRVNDAPKEGA